MAPAGALLCEVMMSELALFDYDLPEELIAATPAGRRDESRLLCLERHTGAVAHRAFFDIVELLRPGDVLIVNDARVIPARLAARRATGARVEVLLVRPREPSGIARPPSGEELTWLALLRPAGVLRQGERLALERAQAAVHLIEKHEGGYWTIRIEGKGLRIEDVLRAGTMPLPPYVLKARRRRGMPPELPALDARRYQTVFARHPGAVAAPTAGLHFTRGLLRRIREAGVQVRALTLMVGPGTFRPVRTKRIEEHVMEPEPYHLPAGTASAVRGALAEGRRIVATGTTCCRALEHAARHAGWRAHSGWTDLFIYPPFEFKVVGALITNFHLPRSTLLMLVCALAGRRNALHAYRIAVEERYRFYSYGDAMFIY